VAAHRPLQPLSAPAPPPEVGGEPSLHPPSVAPAARLEPPPQATGTYWPGLLGRRAHLARDGRGCGALVATYPPIRPGAAGWASGIPAGSPLPRGSFWPSPFLRSSTPRRFRYSPSGEASFPLSGESLEAQGPPPRWRRGPLGWKPRVSRSALSQATTRWPVRAPQGVRGPPLQPFPSYSGSLPLSLAMVFAGPSRGQTPRYGTGYSPRLTWPRHRSRQSSEGITRRGSPVRAWYALPSRLHALAAALFSPFPLRGSKARGTPARDGRAGPQAGQLGAEREFHPPRYRPSYRAPRVMFSPVSRASSLPQPPVASRRPQHRPAPHASWRYVFPPCRGPDSHRVSHAQPLGFTLGTLSGSPNI